MRRIIHNPKQQVIKRKMFETLYTEPPQHTHRLHSTDKNTKEQARAEKTMHASSYTTNLQ
jgi:hypothetical protein